MGSGHRKSFYHWKGVVETSDECLLLVKSSRALFEELRVRLEAAHTYETPELLALPIVEGAPNYMNWLAGNLRDFPKGE